MAEGICAVEGCEKALLCRGWCSRHYQRWCKYGDPLAGNPSPGVAEDHEDGTRTCTKCGLAKPLLTEFDTDRAATLGRRTQCRDCRAGRMKDYYAENRDLKCRQQRQRLHDNPELVRRQDQERYERSRPKRVELAKLIGNKRRAREAGVEFDPTVTLEGLRSRDGDACCYCGVPMTFDLALAHSYDPLRATLEHVIPISRGGGHTWQNAALACWECNIRKGNQTVEEWRSDTPRGTYSDRRSDPTGRVDAGRGMGPGTRG